MLNPDSAKDAERLHFKTGLKLHDTVKVCFPFSLNSELPMKTSYKILTYKNNQKQEVLLFGVRPCTYFSELTDSSQLLPGLYYSSFY